MTRVETTGAALLGARVGGDFKHLIKDKVRGMGRATESAVLSSRLGSEAGTGNNLIWTRSAGRKVDSVHVQLSTGALLPLFRFAIAFLLSPF